MRCTPSRPTQTPCGGASSALLHLAPALVLGATLVAGCEIFDPGGDPLAAGCAALNTQAGEEAEDAPSHPDPGPVPLGPAEPPSAPTSEPGASGTAASDDLPRTPDGCTPVGAWAERWNGRAASDGFRLEGSSELTVRIHRGNLQGIGRIPGKPAHGSHGPMRIEGTRLRYSVTVGGGIASGEYDCGFTAGSCDRMECSLRMLGRFGHLNLTGEAVLTRRP